MNLYDNIIIGSGPAGYTAGIYMARSNSKTLILEGENPGGQLMTTTTIENYPGFESINGFDLIENMKNQAIKNGCETLQLNAVFIEKHNNYFIIKDSNNKLYNTKSIILAMGAYPNKLDFKNSEKYWNKGISSCAASGCMAALDCIKFLEN